MGYEDELIREDDYSQNINTQESTTNQQSDLLHKDDLTLSSTKDLKKGQLTEEEIIQIRTWQESTEFQDGLRGILSEGQDTESSDDSEMQDLINAGSLVTGFDLSEMDLEMNSNDPQKIDSLATRKGKKVKVKGKDKKAAAHEFGHMDQDDVPTTGVINETDVNQDVSLEDKAEKNKTKILKAAKKKQKVKDPSQLKSLPSGEGATQMLSQPNRNIIDAGNQFEDGSEKQQDEQIKALLADAQKALGPFTEVFEMLKSATNASTDKIDQQKKVKYSANHSKVLDPNDPTKEGDIMYTVDHRRPIMETQNLSPSGMGKLKGEERIKQKMNTKYADAGKNAVNEINDVVRGTLAFDGFGELLEAINIIEYHNGTDMGGFNYTIARVKQTYVGNPNEALLYGDVKFNLRVKSGENYLGDEPFDHNCELQLNTIKMLEGKGTVQGHGAYVKWRNLDEEHWENEKCALPPRIGDMKKIYQGRARAAISASHDAYEAAAIDIAEDNADFPKVIEKVKSMQGSDAPQNPQTLAEYMRSNILNDAIRKNDSEYDDFLKQSSDIYLKSDEYLTFLLDIMRQQE